MPDARRKAADMAPDEPELQGGPLAGVASAAGGKSVRVDKWLWYTRVVKSRTMAANLAATGKVRINRERIEKASHALKCDDVVTVTVHRTVRVLKVKALGTRRGPASEAILLYEDLVPPQARGAGARTRMEDAAGADGRAQIRETSNDGVAPNAAAGEPPAEPVAVRDAGAGRPTKRERRAFDRLRDPHRDGED